MFKPLSSFSFALCVAILLASSGAFLIQAQAETAPASVLRSENEAQGFYDMLPTEVFKGRSGCFQRAHYWSYLLQQHYSINSQKIFLFFTNRYKREFDDQWTYHVATMIPTQMNDGSVQELVFDPTYTLDPNPGLSAKTGAVYDNKPISIHEWTRYFIYPNTECKLITNYEEYLENQDLEYCYLMKAPMFNYIPKNFQDDPRGLFGAANSKWFDFKTNTRTNWRLGDMDQMFKALKNNQTYSDLGN